ncbi:PstS family phosphate ABC transporter substrate-binding protein [Lacipirellula parvula]|uniref:Phosphate-binding protein n=1 Tax=Lacipirellula parvula TaxID=2650471 RepID=A0A5K7XBU1_9BACT|nr:PstS family phosphate ABC transporter substrate-binding protein [Lacipirellula parvula]BBO33978.1 phosphate ABC transporter [Lacipirellula parvula]
MNQTVRNSLSSAAKRMPLIPLCLALLASCGCGRTNVVSIDGSSTVFLLSAAIAEEFNAVNPDVKVVVSQAGTGGGFKKFAAGEIHICDASRPITEAEAAACKKNGIEFIKLEVAFDGLAVVVNPANDWCDSITTEQLKTIWRAEAATSVMKWSDVNPDWPDVELELYGPGTDSGTYDYFTEVINGEAKSSRQDYSPSESDNALVQGVTGDKGSLGYFGLGYYAANTDKLKLLPVDSGDGPVAPTAETVRDGSYKPLARPLYVYVRKDALENPGVVKYLRYYLDETNKVSPQVGYVPVTDEIMKQNVETLDAAAPQAVAAK